MQRGVLVGFIGLLVCVGCSGVSPTQVGQTAGGIAGSIIAPGVGAPLGALVGTLAGLVVEEHLDKVREKQERVDLSHELSTSPQAPEAEQPPGEPTRVWVDEQFERGRLLAGHFELQNVP